MPPKLLEMLLVEVQANTRVHHKYWIEKHASYLETYRSVGSLTRLFPECPNRHKEAAEAK